MSTPTDCITDTTDRGGLPRSLASSLLLAAVFSVLLLPASPAEASEGEVSVWLGSGLANAPAVTDEGPQLGTSGQLGIDFGLSDFWGIDFGTQLAYHFPRDLDEGRLDPMFLQNIFAGFRYKIDVFTYVPYISLSAVAWPRAPRANPTSGLRPAVGAKGTIGIDWRFSRHWSTGIFAELHTVNFDFGSFPNYNTVGFNVAYHFRK